MTVPTEKKIDIAGRTIQALTVLLLGGVAFYGKGVISAQETLARQIHSLETRVTVIESNRYTVEDAKADVGLLSGNVKENTVSIAAINGKLDGINDKLDYIIEDVKRP